MGHQRREGGSNPFYNSVNNLYLPNYKRGIKMGAKLGWMIADFLGIPAYMLGVYFNFDNVKSAILFIVGLIYVMIRAYYYAIQKNQSVREKELELWHKEMDKKERMNKIK